MRRQQALRGARAEAMLSDESDAALAASARASRKPGLRK